MPNHREAKLSESIWHDKLLELWKKLLKSEDVSIDDDFFEKGGDSLLAIDMQLELQRLTGLELPESLLFESSTVRALADRLSRQFRLPPGTVMFTGRGAVGE
jgi:acyl carrier protein